MRLQGKTAFITGGSSGIGLATAELFVKQGARVAITGRDRGRLDGVKRTLGDILAFEADVQDDAAMERALAATSKAFHGIDIVFANAGISANTALGSTPRAVFEQVIATNVTGVFMTLQAALPYLKDGASLIINGSISASMGPPARAAYAASKGAVRAMARSLATELSPRNIRVNLVIPGATDTPIWQLSAPDAAARASLEARLAARTPLNRMIRAEEIANAVLFLASDESSGMQAAEIVVDGGTTGAPAGSPIHMGQ